LDKNGRNPVYPGALCFSDVDKGVLYREVCAITGLKDPCVFLEKPTMSNIPHYQGYYASISLYPGFESKDKRLKLTDAGIMSDAEGNWALIYFCIADNIESVAKYKIWLRDGGQAILDESITMHVKKFFKESGGDEIFCVYDPDSYCTADCPKCSQNPSLVDNFL